MNMFYVTSFLFFSIFGFLGEFLLSRIMNQSKETLLLGPWMPIYGIGFLVTHFINKILEKKEIIGKKKILLCYLFSVLALTLLEEIGGLLTWALFHKNYWDYSSIPLSIGPYINVFISLIWGFLALLIEYVILPKISFLLKKIPKWLTLILLILFLLDNYFCLKRNHIFAWNYFIVDKLNLHRF